MQDYLMGETILAGTDTAKIDSRSANKYTNLTQMPLFMSKKMKLTPELKNALKIAKKEGNSLPIKENSKYRNWEYYKFKFELSEKVFEGTINIGIDKKGNKHFYEINKIHIIPNSSVSTNRPGKYRLSINSIPQSKEKGNTTTKYSMQKNKNNACKGYLNKIMVIRFRVTLFQIVIIQWKKL